MNVRLRASTFAPPKADTRRSDVPMALREIGPRALHSLLMREPHFHLFGVPVCLVQREDENLLQHLDHIIVGVIVVVQEHDPVEGNRAFPFYDFRLGGSRGGYQRLRYA